MKLLKPLLICIAFAICTLSATAQLSSEVRLASVDLRYSNDKVQVPYKIINGKTTDRYVVWVEFFNEKNQLLTAKTVQGDINLVQGNGDKLITWDAKADGFALNEKLTARVNAKLIPDASTGKAFFYSTLFPGAGDYQFKIGRPYWLYGTLAYGLIGGSIGAYIMSNNAYSKYQNSYLPHTEDPNYKSAQQYRQLSLLMAGAGVAIWLIDYAGITSKSKKYKNLKPQTVIADNGYRLYSATSPAQTINTRGLPPNLFADLEFIDDNRNGILENQESAQLKITLSNYGLGDAMLLDVNVTSNITDKSFKIGNPKQKISVLRPSEIKEVIIPITTDIDLKTATHRLAINVSEHYGYDMEPAYLVLNTYAYQPPQFAISGYEIIDSGIGTMALKSDGKLQVGEQVKVKLVVQNTGQGVANNAVYTISTTDPNIFIDDVNGKLGNVLPGEVKEIYFTLSPNRRVTIKDNLPIFLTITEDIGRGSLKNQQLPIALDQTPPKPNIVEIKSDVESLKKNVARFEYTSNKFRANIANVVNIATVAPSQTKRPNSVGVVIGVSQYKELPPAPYADNDAKIMKNYLEKVLGVEQVIQYTNEQVAGFFFDDIFNPDVGELRKAIVKGESEVFVFYSGHGVPDKDGKNIFLFPSDGKVTRLETQGYNIEKLYENLSRLGAKHVTVILDACFSGASRSSVKVATENLIGQKGVRVRPKNTWLGDPNFTVITSSTGEETSLGFDETQTGLFTYFLAAGLQGAADANGDKVITLGELKDYVVNNVKETSGKILGTQTPMFHGDDNRVMATY
ncbi:caspase family protein [Tenuifilum sp.]|uniref:caspase family protein n=3 Tax=Tenuifilum sp. TaxID=2760880 RepID=UPI002B7224BD|nr:caspase family protein [Tenuifilum sp.]